MPSTEKTAASAKGDEEGAGQVRVVVLDVVEAGLSAAASPRGGKIVLGRRLAALLSGADRSRLGRRESVKADQVGARVAGDADVVEVLRLDAGGVEQRIGAPENRPNT
jgi:hypothetical protein